MRSRDAILGAMRSWRRRQDALTAERDPLVMEGIAHPEVSKEDIHQATGLGRSTIDRIEDRPGPAAAPGTEAGR